MICFHPVNLGFRKNDSCISQLLSITHEIFKGFDANPPLDTCGVFLDISKAFDKVWHEGLIFKLQSYGISGCLLSLLKDFLSDRLQRVVINGQSSTWESILAGAPQGSILGPLLFLIYINDLPLNLESSQNFYWRYFSLINNQKSCEDKLNRGLDRISAWAYQWKMSFNPDLTKQATEVCFSRKSDPSDIQSLFLNNIQVDSRHSQ